MAMSTHIEAFIPDTDETFTKHKGVLLACNKAGVSLPKETAEYFGDSEPSTYLLDEKLQIPLKNSVHYKQWSDDSSVGFEVYLKDLPKGTNKLRFYNNW